VSGPLRRERLLPVVLGLSDGMLTALTLAAGALVGSGPEITIGLSLRIATAALVSAGFAFFVAKYAELRAELVRTGHQLSLRPDQDLATTQLGRVVRREAAESALITSGASFAGALVPLLTGAVLPGPAWLGIPVAIAALTALGAGVAIALGGRPAVWAVSLGLGGLLLTIIGAQLKIA
jgi:VIT1/CCC1 family predicted Fe2+/Mn2+ transporter